ncbi:hypothetical protein NS365_07825 [Aureimonas ureilytica]|uniref:Uncharacterized protein n=1 Tax=Aureimonas ureilytica TaxID=401562 RepID=A0A175RTK2_9HYPH|nr:hypothetical protein NS365_07825 [Aureimonas ureilytica]
MAVEDFAVQAFVPKLGDDALAIVIPQGKPGSVKTIMAPTAVTQSRTALAMNSGPLSERICPGAPRWIRRSDRTLVVGGLQLPVDPDGEALMGELVDDVGEKRAAFVARHAELAPLWEQ